MTRGEGFKRRHEFGDQDRKVFIDYAEHHPACAGDVRRYLVEPVIIHFGTFEPEIAAALGNPPKQWIIDCRLVSENRIVSFALANLRAWEPSP